MEKLISYLTDKLGLKAEALDRPYDRPEVLKSERFKRYESSYISIDGERVLLIKPPSNAELGGKKLTSDYRKVCRFYNGVVLMWLPSVDYALRKTLVSNRVNFIVVGSQLYLPSLYISLQEKNLKVIQESETLSIPAQVVVIYHLVKKSLNGIPLTHVAKLVGYSPKTLSLVTQELVSKGIISLNRDGRTSKYMTFKFGGKQLWDSVKGLMVSPIVKTGYCGKRLLDSFENSGKGIYRAGKEAFKEYAFGDDYTEIATAAIYKDRLQQSGLVIDSTNTYSTKIEVWRYDPDILAVGRYVDPCSLYLSLRDRVTPNQAKELSRIFRWWTWQG
ncbi:MAG: hypothetical protein NC548_49190 [Lachnospiraceae bacterium]|nr:hypothetical protein [Lachnospiraceae bacterium]